MRGCSSSGVQGGFGTSMFGFGSKSEGLTTRICVVIFCNRVPCYHLLLMGP